jgi:TfoX/Sxy family transcriptional regulator of competence genes
MTETQSSEKLGDLMDRTFKYKDRVYLFKSFKPLPVGRFSIFTDGPVISRFHSEMEEFFSQIQEVDQKKWKPKPPMAVSIVTPAPKKPINNFKNFDLITMDIKESTNYDKFKSITGNRNLNTRKIEKIVDDVKHGFNMLPYCPIIVYVKDQNLMVIDGQHRIEVSKRTKNPVYYVECQELSLKQIAQLNSRGEKWSPTDFLNCYVRLGIEDYRILREVVNEYGLGIVAAADFLMNWYMRGRTQEIFQDGNFKCNHHDKVVDLLELVRKTFGSNVMYVNDKKMIAAVQRIQEKGICDFARLATKVEANPGMLEKLHDTKKYCALLESIYNVNGRDRVTIW